MGGLVKRLAVLGSTGSIGQQALDVVRTLPDRFRIIGLAAGKNIDLLAEQMNEFKPEFACYSPENERFLGQNTLLPSEVAKLKRKTEVENPGLNQIRG